MMLSLLAFSMIFIGVDRASTIDINLNKPVAFTSSRFTSYNFDWHTNNQQHWENCSIQIINLNSTSLNTAVSGMPTRLRIGGSQEDDIVYNVNGNECNELNTNPAFCLNMSRWREIVQFTETHNIDLVFGLNAMSRSNSTSSANFSNIISFLNYTYIHNLTVYGWEYGNELGNESVDATVDGHDFITLYFIIQSIWNSSGKATKDDIPKLMGNDLNPNGASYLQTWFPIVSDYLDIFTYHNYDGNSGDKHLPHEIVTPGFLDKTYTKIEKTLKLYNMYINTSKTEIWIGESAAALDSGQPNTTDAFVSSFWYSDALGRLSLLNHTGFQRQTLIGGAYGLLTHANKSNDGYMPNPDYYTGKLFHDLVGDKILNVTNITNDYNGYFRVYSYCSRLLDGNIGVLLINISPNITVNASIQIFGPIGIGSIISMKIYSLSTAETGNLRSRFMKLNGKQLMMINDSQLPCLTDCPLLKQGNNLEIEPYHIVFVDAEPETKNNICF